MQEDSGLFKEALGQPCALAVFEVETVGRPNGGHLQDHRRRSWEHGRHVKRRLKVVGHGRDVIGVDLLKLFLLLLLLNLGLLHLLGVEGVLALALAKNLLEQGLPGVRAAESIERFEDDAGLRDRLVDGQVGLGQVRPAHLGRMPQGVKAGKLHSRLMT